RGWPPRPDGDAGGGRARPRRGGSMAAARTGRRPPGRDPARRRTARVPRIPRRRAHVQPAHAPAALQSHRRHAPTDPGRRHRARLPSAAVLHRGGQRGLVAVSFDGPYGVSGTTDVAMTRSLSPGMIPVTTTESPFARV